MVLSAASNWLKKRQDQDAATRRRPGSPPPTRVPRPGPAPTAPPRPAAPSSGVDWAEELRRLLEGEPTEVMPPPTPPSPPTPAAAPAQTRTAPPMPPPPLEGLPVPTTSRVSFPRAPIASDEAPAPGFELATMEASQAAYQGAAALPVRSTRRLQRVVEQTARPTPASPLPHSPAGPPEAITVLAQLRQPRTTRQAILAAVILGPPKALETSPSSSLFF